MIMFISSLELEARMIEIDEEIQELKHQLDNMPYSGLTVLDGQPAFICNHSDDRMCIWANLGQYQELREELQGDWLYAKSAETEAKRLQCSPEEVIAFREGRCTYIPDYDDHSSDDARAEHNILCEVGMNIQTNPYGISELNLDL